MQTARAVLAALFIAAGVNHFLSPSVYVAIVPPALPFPAALVYLSGAAEIIGGIALLFASTRRVAGVGLIALLVAVFPANVYAAVSGMEISGRAVPPWMLWVRLPLQALLIALVYAVAVRRRLAVVRKASITPHNRRDDRDNPEQVQRNRSHREDDAREDPDNNEQNCDPN